MATHPLDSPALLSPAAKKYSPAEVGIGVFILVCAGALVQLMHLADGSGTILGHFRRLRLLQMAPMGGLVLLGFGLLLAARSKNGGRLLAGIFDRVRAAFAALGVLNWTLFALLAAAYPAFSISELRLNIEHTLPGIWVFAALAFLAALCLQAAQGSWSFGTAYVISAAASAAVLSLAFYVVTISPYPFSMAWSESSQIYFASTYLARSIYGFWVPLPVIQPGYEILMTLPYLAGQLPIWVHRLWLVLLWLGFTLGTGLAMARSLRIPGLPHRVIFVLYSFIYLLNIPVYFHLLACVFLVFFGFASRRPGARWAGLIAASIWAGVCRVNWFPLPGVLAAALFILDHRWEGRGWRYFLQPAAWIAAGTGTAFAANAVYMLGSGNPLYYFATTFSSPLLWYRLFPSMDSPLGVLADVLLYSLPLAAVLGYGLVRWKAWHALRLAALGLFLLVFFAGGLVVSAKIGGGNNIHNLDAFFVLLLVIAASLYFGRFAPDRELEVSRVGIPTGLVVGALCLTGLLGLAGRELSLPQPIAGAEEAIAVIQANIDAVTRGGGGEILFTTERQLLSLGMVRGAKLVPAYDKWFLMEMAMGGNQTFYSQFDQAVRSRRFALIVSEPLQLGSRSGRPFEEENNVFMKYVSAEVLANYTAAAEFPQFGFTIYRPK